MHYLNGDKLNFLILPVGNNVTGLNFDPSGVQTQTGNWGGFGYGTYKIVFTWSDDGYAECYYDMDAGINIDLTFKVKSINGSPVIYYAFAPNYPPGHTQVFVPITSVSGYIKNWKPYAPQHCTDCQWIVRPTGIVYGEFLYNNPNTFGYKFPLDSREDSDVLTTIPTEYIDQNQSFNSSNNGNIGLNLTIIESVQTPVTGNRNNVVLLNNSDYEQPTGATLKISSNGSSNTTLTLRKFNAGNYGTDLTIKSYSKLKLDSSVNTTYNARLDVQDFCNVDVESHGNIDLKDNSKISLQENSNLIFRKNSNLEMNDNSLIEIESDAKLIDCGTTLNSKGINMITIERYILI